MTGAAPGLVRWVIVTTLLTVLAVAQRLGPRAALPAPPPLAPVGHLSGLPSVRVFAAAGVPGAELLAARFGRPARLLQVDPEFARAVEEDLPWDPERLPFAAPPEVLSMRPLVLNGDGNFHHLTYFVLSALVEPRGASYTVVSFDAHDDLRSPRATAAGEERAIDCGNWGRWSLGRLSNLRHIVQAGTVPQHLGDVFRWYDDALLAGRAQLVPAVATSLFFSRPPALPASDAQFASRDLLGSLSRPGAVLVRHPGWPAPLEQLRARVPPGPIYLTVDLDVLSAADFPELDWGAGEVALADLVRAIDSIAAEHPVLGADLVGFAPGLLGTDAAAEEKGLAAYSRVAEALLRALERAHPTSAGEALK